MIQIVPAIDIIEGRCVRLSQGDYDQKKVYDGKPEDVARAFADAGVRRIHLVDLDGAKKSAPVNLKTLESIANKVNDVELEWGGGLKEENHLRSAFDAGATNAVIGSTAALQPELFEQWLGIFGGKKMVLGADVRNGKIAVKGWLEEAAMGIDDLCDRFLPFGLEESIVTDISKDGMLQGPSTGLYTTLQSKYDGITFTVSGGISSMEDIQNLNDLGLRRVITGKAFYEGRISLKDIEKWSLNA